MLFEKETNIDIKNKVEKELSDLNAQIFAIEELYSVAKTYNLFEIVLEILFLMSKSHEKCFISISVEEIAFVYENYFRSTILTVGNYPYCLFPIVYIL